MAGSVDVVARPFVARVRSSSLWGHVAFVMPRLALVGALASLPFAALLAIALLAPADVLREMTDTSSVEELFSRLVGSVVTASSIAVSVTTLSIRRKLRGLEDTEHHGEADLAYRERVRGHLGKRELPLALHGVLAAVAEGIAEAARDVAIHGRRRSTPVEGVELATYGEKLAESASRVSRLLARAEGRPDALLRYAVDLETEMAGYVARRFLRRDDLDAPTRAALERLEERVRDYNVGARYAKTLTTQWGLSRMSTAILVTTLPSVVIAAVFVLGYGEWVPALLGAAGATILLGAAMSVVTLPLAAFVSYLLRFVFVHQFTLPTEGFTLGMEEARAGRGERGARLRGRPG